MKKVVVSIIMTVFFSACTKVCDSGEGCEHIKIYVKDEKLVVKNSGAEIIEFLYLEVWSPESSE